MIQIKHRNSLETWSRAGGETYTVGNTLHYNFTADSAKAFGNNMKKILTKWTIYSGDVNKDGNVDVTDIISVYNDGNNFVSGYVPTDVTGDNFVDAGDLIVTYNNSINFVSVIRP